MKKDNKFYRLCFFTLLIPVTCFFIVLYIYNYQNQLKEFHAENQKTAALIAGKIDDAILTSNTNAMQISASPYIRYIEEKKGRDSMVDYKYLFDFIQQHMNRNTLFDSIYVYFVAPGKVLTNISLYDAVTFYDQSIIKSISNISPDSDWISSRRISPDDTTYIRPVNVITLVNSYPSASDYPTAYVIVNLNQESLLKRISEFKFASRVSLGYKDQVIASMDTRLLGKRLSEVYKNMSLTNDSGFGEGSIGQYTYYYKSKITGFIYFHNIDRKDFNQSFARYQVTILLMYLVCIITLLLLSYLISKLTRNRFGYLLRKLYDQSGRKNNTNEDFTALEEAIDSFVLHNKEVEEKVKSYNNIVKDILILDIITGNFSSIEELYKHLSYSNLSFGHPYFTAVIALILDFENSKDLQNNSYNFKLYLKDTITGKLSEGFKVYSALVDNEKIAFIINHPLEHETMNTTLSSTLQEINASIQHELETYLLFSIGTSVGDILEVTDSYFIAKKNLDFRGMRDSNLIITGKDIGTDSLVFPVAIHHKIINGFKNNSKNALTEGFDAFYKEFLINHAYSSEMVKNIATILFCSIITTLWDNAFEISMMDSSEIINSISRKNNAKELIEYLKSIFSSILEKQPTYTSLNKSDNTLYITKVVNFINENFHKDLSISDIAKCVDLNPRYLGALFKEATGKTLVEYLNLVRIKWAKQLLSGAGKSIKEISFEVGYNDVHSFIRHFKKVCAVTPSEYRESSNNNGIFEGLP